MGQSFREQLAQSTALAQRVVTKISGRKERFFFLKLSLLLFKISPLHLSSFLSTGERVESHDDKTGHELLALR